MFVHQIKTPKNSNFFVEMRLAYPERKLPKREYGYKDVVSLVLARFRVMDMDMEPPTNFRPPSPSEHGTEKRRFICFQPILRQVK